jgi:hypothetical protein
VDDLELAVGKPAAVMVVVAEFGMTISQEQEEEEQPQVLYETLGFERRNPKFLEERRKRKRN